MTFTYDDFERAIKEAGLDGQFSQADLNLARQNPDAGMSILNYKKDWKNATTDDQRALAQAGAQSTRSDYGGYTGDGSGGSYYKDPQSPGSYSAPEYESKYSGQISGTLDKITNSKFDYNHETDPLYGSYKKEYTREGERATRDTLGNAAASSGGIASTAAVTAASQAGQYYGAKLADKVPELRQQKYNEFMQEKNADLAILNAMQNLDNSDYSKYSDGRDFGYNQNLADVGFDTNKEQSKYEREEYAKQQERKRQEERAKNLAALGDFSGFKELGYSDAEITKLFDEWKFDNPKKAAALYPAKPTPKSGGTGSGAVKSQNAGGGKVNTTELVKAAYSGGYTQAEQITSAKEMLSAGTIDQDTYNRLVYSIMRHGKR
ncbi:MAG: hypothetical protein RR394_05245 [Oscillospiraceae bacterium]